MIYGKSHKESLKAIKLEAQICMYPIQNWNGIAKIVLIKEIKLAFDHTASKFHPMKDTKLISKYLTIPYVTVGALHILILLVSAFHMVKTEDCRKKLPDYILHKSPLIFIEIALFVHLKLAENTNELLFKSFIKVLMNFSCNYFFKNTVRVVLLQTFPEHPTQHQCRWKGPKETHDCSCSMLDMIIVYYHSGLVEDIETWLIKLSEDHSAIQITQSYWNKYFNICNAQLEKSKMKQISNIRYYEVGSPKMLHFLRSIWMKWQTIQPIYLTFYVIRCMEDGRFLYFIKTLFTSSIIKDYLLQ